MFRVFVEVRLPKPSEDSRQKEQKEESRLGRPLGVPSPGPNQ
jgi:hypothetical protein